LSLWQGLHPIFYILRAAEELSVFCMEGSLEKFLGAINLPRSCFVLYVKPARGSFAKQSSERRTTVNAVEFQAEVLRLERLMYRVSYAMLRNEEDCADAVQEALTRAWKKRGSLRSMDRFKPWLMRILVNQCNDMLRRQQKRSYIPLEDIPLADQAATTPIPLKEAIEALAPKLRITVTLHYWEGYSVQETAKMLGLPSGTVKSRLRAARRELSALLQDEWEDEV